MKTIAYPRFGENILRLCRIALNLLAQGFDVQACGRSPPRTARKSLFLPEVAHAETRRNTCAGDVSGHAARTSATTADLAAGGSGRARPGETRFGKPGSVILCQTVHSLRTAHSTPAVRNLEPDTPEWQIFLEIVGHPNTAFPSARIVWCFSGWRPRL